MARSTRVGRLPPRYGFILNPHAGTRLSKCPRCERHTHPRKFAFLIHVDGWGPMALGKTCKYCSRCELIMMHRDELEAELTYSFSKAEGKRRVFRPLLKKLFEAELAAQGRAGPERVGLRTLGSAYHFGRAKTSSARPSGTKTTPSESAQGLKLKVVEYIGTALIIFFKTGGNRDFLRIFCAPPHALSRSGLVSWHSLRLEV